MPPSPLALIHLSPLHALGTLGLIVAASVVMFVWNVRRSTTQRPMLELKQWARNNRMTLAPPPPPIVSRLLPDARVDRIIGDGDRTLLRLYGPAGTSHLLVLHLPDPAHDWPPTALRPAHGDPRPLLDSVPLKAYPSLPGTERFTTLGTTLHTARTLAHSHVRALLPPDLGLLLHGRWLLLDFSPRPFDLLEFSRLLSLADQLRRHLPVPNDGGGT